MLTKSHYAARHYVTAKDRTLYRQHMCGLCHTLGGQYGFATRLLTNHEAILLSILTNAQHPAEMSTVTQRCPLNPSRKMIGNDDIAGQFAAATAITLAAISVDDDVQDSNGRDVVAKMADRLLKNPQHKALQNMAKLGFDIDILRQLNSRQSGVEQNDGNSEIPSSIAAGKLFEMTAVLAGNEANKESLSDIGKQYGAYLYFADAYRDFAQDIAKGDYNPLRRFSIQWNGHLMLSHAGLDWLLGRLRDILSTIQREITILRLYRYEDTVTRFLTKPIIALIRKLDSQISQKENVAFRQWSIVDVLKAMFFVMPTPVAATGFAGLSMTDDEKPKRGQKRKRKRKESASKKENSSLDSCLCDGLYFVNCTDCDTDGDGVCDCDVPDCGGCDSCGDADCGGVDCG